MKERLLRLAGRLDRSLLPFMGPAQLGAGRDEEPYRLPDDPRCPLCGRSLSLHRIERAADGSRATRLHCPPRDS